MDQIWVLKGPRHLQLDGQPVVYDQNADEVLATRLDPQALSEISALKGDKS